MVRRAASELSGQWVNELLRTTRRNNSTDSPVLVRTEANVYGASRIGVHELPMPTTPPQPDTMEVRATGRYNYEITDHLGNVRATVSDLKTFVTAGMPANTYRLDASLQSANDYYPFGLPSRTFQPSYKWGFNGKENDREVLTGGRFQDYGFRAYRPDLGRFFAVDPLTREYPFYTPYQFAGNEVIRYIDLDGLEPAHFTMNNGKIVMVLASDRLTQNMPANAVYRHSSAAAQKAKLISDLRDIENAAEKTGTAARLTATGAGIVTAAAPNPVTAAVTAGAATTAGAADATAVTAGMFADFLEGKPLSAVLKGGLQLLGSKLTGGLGKVIQKSKIGREEVKNATSTFAQTGTDLGKQAIEDVSKKELAKKEETFNSGKPKKVNQASKPPAAPVSKEKEPTTIGPKKL